LFALTIRTVIAHKFKKITARIRKQWLSLLPESQKSQKTFHSYVVLSTVRWSNFDRLDPKMGVFLQSTEATPADMFLNESLPPETPLRTPCSWPPWPWFSREKSLKIFKVS
jgi:hypothetical protein